MQLGGNQKMKTEQIRNMEATKHKTGRRIRCSSFAMLVLLAAFLLGNMTAELKEKMVTAGWKQKTVNGEGDEYTEPEEDKDTEPEENKDTEPEEDKDTVQEENGKAAGSGRTANEAAAARVSAPQPAVEGDWGLCFREEGKPPEANATIDELAPYDAWYAEDTGEKVMYLTFDCGYENGNTEKILAALKKHNVKATFFAVANFIRDNPELVKRMIADGHTIGNHTVHHPDMSKISDMEAFREELEGVEQLYKEVTGSEIARYYRPPQGKFSFRNLEMAKELGYRTLFWSLAYIDWKQDQQPTKEKAFERLLTYAHPGAIVLLHNTSATNGAILDELLTRWEEMGYRFGVLGELGGRKTKKKNSVEAEKGID